MSGCQKGCDAWFCRLGSRGELALAANAPGVAPGMIGAGMTPLCCLLRHLSHRGTLAIRPPALPPLTDLGNRAHFLLRCDCHLSPSLPLPPSLAFRSSLCLLNLCPYLGPSITTDRIAQCQHRIDMRFRPMHP